MEFGTGERQRTISLHKLHARFRAAFCSILVKAHMFFLAMMLSVKLAPSMLHSHAIHSLLLTLLKLIHYCYLNGKALTDLPPTSSAICGHIRRCFCVIRNAITLLETHQHDLLDQNFGWTNDRQTDRQTDRYFIDRNKSHYRLICHSNEIYVHVCIYNNVNLLK